ncbi:MAG: hypothetical protein ACRC4T_05795 [Cetobacterium sp.]
MKKVLLGLFLIIGKSSFPYTIHIYSRSNKDESTRNTYKENDIVIKKDSMIKFLESDGYKYVYIKDLNFIYAVKKVDDFVQANSIFIKTNHVYINVAHKSDIGYSYNHEEDDLLKAYIGYPDNKVLLGQIENFNTQRIEYFINAEIKKQKDSKEFVNPFDTKENKAFLRNWNKNVDYKLEELTNGVIDKEDLRILNYYYDKDSSLSSSFNTVLKNALELKYNDHTYDIGADIYYLKKTIAIEKYREIAEQKEIEKKKKQSDKMKKKYNIE